VLRGIDTLLASGGVKHMVMETHNTQVDVVMWLYDLGFVCGNYERQMWSRDQAALKIASIVAGGYWDVYCRFQAVTNASAAVGRKLLVPELRGTYAPGSGWH
jgi:hypothetical protein